MTITAVPVRKLGNQGLAAPAQGLGCMGMTYSYTTTEGWGGEQESIATVNRAAELGVNLLDTSDIYGPFTNEELLGALRRPARPGGGAQPTARCIPVLHHQLQHPQDAAECTNATDARVKPPCPVPRAGKAIKGNRSKFIIASKCGIVKTESGLIFDGSRKHVREACEASLKRLGTDYIDLYYLHR